MLVPRRGGVERRGLDARDVETATGGFSDAIDGLASTPNHMPDNVVGNVHAHGNLPATARGGKGAKIEYHNTFATARPVGREWGGGDTNLILCTFRAVA